MNVSRLSIALQAARQLGLTQVGLNVLYKLGVKIGYFRWQERRKTKESHLSSFIFLFNFPSRKQLLATLGEAGLQTLRAEADEIVAGQFRQFGGEPVEINLTPSTPLLHWTEYETGHLQPSTSDIKLVWEPARFGWAFTLGRAYHATGDEKYPEAFWRLFETFNAANPTYLGPNWMSGQEVGIRLMAFVWAAQVFSASVQTTPARLAALAASTAFHAARIPATLLYARSQNNNHLLTEAAALYTAALALPDHPDTLRWQKLGQKWLTWCFQNQIDQHGEYVQHSTNYHRLMLQTALWVKGLKSKVENPRSDLRPLTFDSPHLALATHWLLSLLDFESGQVPNLGANDGAIIFPLSSSPFSDYRPIAQASARAFLKLTLPPGPWDEMALWYGLPHADEHSEITRYPGDHIYANNSWAMLRAVKLTARPSHADQLHCDLWWRGLNIAQDAGTYLYNAAPPWDNALTSTLVHNTVTIDGLEQMTRVSRFLYLDWANASRKQHFETGADFLERFSASTEAYARLGVRHTRTVSVYPAERWLVTDELLNAQPAAHTYRLHWLLPDWEWALEKREQGVELRLKSPRGWIKVGISSQQPVKRIGLIRAGELVSGEGLVSPIFGWVSPTYAHKIPALSLALEVQSTDNVKFTTEFVFPAP